MFRFTIRDLLWLTVVVALVVAWWVDRRTQAERIDELEKAAAANMTFGGATDFGGDIDLSLAAPKP